MIPDFSAMSDGHIFLSIFCAALAIVFMVAAAVGLNGKRRSWVYTVYSKASGYGPTFHTTNLPFKMAGTSLVLLVIVFETLLKYTSYTSLANGPLFALLLLLAMVVTLAPSFWWPPFLGPRWYRQWRRAEPRTLTLPYTSEELNDVHQNPDTPENRRRLVDIENCKSRIKDLRREYAERAQRERNRRRR